MSRNLVQILIKTLNVYLCPTQCIVCSLMLVLESLGHKDLQLLLRMRFSNKHSVINYSCSSYPTRASYSGQVDEFKKPMRNELKTRP